MRPRDKLGLVHRLLRGFVTRWQIIIILIIRGRKRRNKQQRSFRNIIAGIKFGKIPPDLNCRLLPSHMREDEWLMVGRNQDARWGELMKSTEEHAYAQEQLENRNDVRSR